MFAVPGWSVSAASLKTELAKPDKGTAGSKSKSKKRKRAGAAAAPAAAGHEGIVTKANVAQLYGNIIEGEPPGTGQGNAPAKKRKKEDGLAGSGRSRTGQPQGKSREHSSEAKDEAPEHVKDSRRRKQKHRKHESAPAAQNASAAPFESDKLSSKSSAGPNTTTKQSQQLSQLRTPEKLTPLQAAMRDKLVSARFRHLNETLYTRPSGESYRLFHDSPEMFNEYHDGFRRQVKVWPENPVDKFLHDIRTRAKVKTPAKSKPGSAKLLLDRSGASPLPRTAGVCTIADLGCGDARLAESLQSDKAALRVDVKSYDLQSPSPLVTMADIASLPLADGSVNIAIFCLALMGTNWIDFVEEAYRVLHWKGELWIAEIKSRFASPSAHGGARNQPVSHSVGNRRKLPAKKAKTGDAQGVPAAQAKEDLEVEVDGNEDRRRETDVSAFVDVLNARGFVLQGERREAVDLSNKMFVKMHFVKAAPPTKGKGVRAAEGGRLKKPGIRWLNEEDHQDTSAVDEAAVLKPCVYKIR